MATRKYTKKSSYWDQFKEQPVEQLIRETQGSEEPWEPILTGDPYYTAESKAYERSGSGSSGATSRTSTRGNYAAIGPKLFRYANIREGSLPYFYSKIGVDIRDAVMLCQRAYANIPIFRNVIDIMSEFANTELYIEGGD